MQDSHSQLIRSARSGWTMALLFITLFIALQYAWSAARGSFIERLIINDATVGVAVSIINAWSPGVQALGVGATIRATGGGINILNGCEGTEVLFLLVAAVFAYPMMWRWRAIGLFAGTVYVFLLNQMRLLALFYSYRSDRVLFGHLHGVVAPLALVAATLIFFLYLMKMNERSVLKQAAC